MIEFNPYIRKRCPTCSDNKRIKRNIFYCIKCECAYVRKLNDDYKKDILKYIGKIVAAYLLFTALLFVQMKMSSDRLNLTVFITYLLLIIGYTTFEGIRLARIATQKSGFLKIENQDELRNIISEVRVGRKGFVITLFSVFFALVYFGNVGTLERLALMLAVMGIFAALAEAYHVRRMISFSKKRINT